MDRSAPKTRSAALAPGGKFSGVCRGALAGLAHALHVDVDQLAQLRDQLSDVHACAAVDGGGYSRVSNEIRSRSAESGRHSPHRVTGHSRGGRIRRCSTPGVLARLLSSSARRP